MPHISIWPRCRARTVWEGAGGVPVVEPFPLKREIQWVAWLARESTKFAVKVPGLHSVSALLLTTHIS